MGQRGAEEEGGQGAQRAESSGQWKLRIAERGGRIESGKSESNGHGAARECHPGLDSPHVFGEQVTNLLLGHFHRSFAKQVKRHLPFFRCSGIFPEILLKRVLDEAH